MERLPNCFMQVFALLCIVCLFCIPCPDAKVNKGSVANFPSSPTIKH